MNNRQHFKAILSAILFCLIPSVFCQQRDAESKNDASVVAWIKDEALVTVNDIAQYKKQMIEENPQLEQYINVVPAEEIDRSIAELLLQQSLVDLYITNSKISEKLEYQKDLETTIQMATTAVNNKYFTQEIAAAVNPTEKELRSFYQEYKTIIPGMQKERGGIKTVGVSFDSEDKAKAFLKKVNTSDLSQIAKKDNLAIKDFGIVSKSSMTIDENIRNSVLAATKFPQTMIITDMDDTTWVVQAVSKKEDVFYPYEDVKDLVKDRAFQYQIAEKRSIKLNDLKKSYVVTVNEDFFGDTEPLTVNKEDVETLIEALEDEGI